jgi:hypothetical protein
LLSPLRVVFNAFPSTVVDFIALLRANGAFLIPRSEELSCDPPYVGC